MRGLSGLPRAECSAAILACSYATLRVIIRVIRVILTCSLDEGLLRRLLKGLLGLLELPGTSLITTLVSDLYKHPKHQGYHMSEYHVSKGYQGGLYTREYLYRIPGLSGLSGLLGLLGLLPLNHLI